MQKQPWMDDDRFREAWLEGMKLEAIRLLNKELTDHLPSVAAVSRRAKSLRLPSRKPGVRPRVDADVK